jgi:large subunit ribosomal protein L25
MAKEANLKVQRRLGTGKGVARKLRAAGRLPAVLYGGDGEAEHISLDSHDTLYLFQNISVDNTILELEIEGEKAPVRALVREIQTHPWKGSLLHVDFLRVQKGVAVDVDVPLRLVGTPKGVREQGGSMEQIIYDIAIRCIPSKIPEFIEVDVSHLEVDEVLHVSGLTFGEGVEVTISMDRTVAVVSSPKGGASGDGQDADPSADGGSDEDGEA